MPTKPKRRLAITDSYQMQSVMEDCNFLFGYGISYVDLNQLCEDVQEIARKCGKNTMDNYGHNRNPALVRIHTGVMTTKVTFHDLARVSDDVNQIMIKECSFGYGYDLCRFMKEKYPTHALYGQEFVEWGKDSAVGL